MPDKTLELHHFVAPKPIEALTRSPYNRDMSLFLDTDLDVQTSYTQAKTKFFRRWLIPHFHQKSESEDRLAWLVLLRWLAIGIQLPVILLATQLMFIPLALSPLLLGLSAGLIPINLWACHRLSQSHVPETRRQLELLYFLALDLVQFMLILAFTQGIHNPFYPLIFVHVVLGSVLLQREQNWAYWIILGAGLYLLNPVVYIFNSQQTYVRMAALVSWGIQMGVVTVVWAIAGAASRRVARYRQQLEKLAHQQQQLQQVHLLGALGAGVAHEFATPLGTLKMRLERIKRQQNPLSPDLKAALKALDQCEQRLRSISALPTHAELINLKPVLIQPYLRDWVAKWQSQQPQIQVRFEDQTTTPAQIFAPTLILDQALENLFRNAAQALAKTPPSEAQVWLALHQRQSGYSTQIELTITDNGPGWPEAVLKHLGEPFVSTRTEGTGLGLYSVHMLALSLGGSLCLSSPASGGAAACLTLPLERS